MKRARRVGISDRGRRAYLPTELTFYWFIFSPTSLFSCLLELARRVSETLYVQYDDTPESTTEREAPGRLLQSIKVHTQQKATLLFTMLTVKYFYAMITIQTLGSFRSAICVYLDLMKVDLLFLISV